MVSAVLNKFKRERAFRFDLGFKNLVNDWKKLFDRDGLPQDIFSGLTVACIAIPLSLAIALASGVNPEVGLISAVIGGAVVALTGGTPLAVSGPAAAMAVLIASVVAQHGLGGLLVVGIGCGILQLLCGVFNLGRYIRFVPLPVIAGFTAGIGAIILVGQLPRALGLPAPENSQVLHVMGHLWEHVTRTEMSSLGLCLGTVAIIFGLPKLAPKLPASLVAVIVVTVLSILLDFDIKRIGEIPSRLPGPQLPKLPEAGLTTLLSSTLTVFALASLETLLSSSAADKLARGKRHDPDQELIGQGLGNIATAFFGGIPVTGVIARTALNIQSGARTRRAALIHSGVLLLSIYLISPLIAYIPIAVLAGILIAVALRMLHPREFLEVWHSSRIDGLVYFITFLTIIFTDLILGVQAGIAAALAIAAIRLGQTSAMIHVDSIGGTYSVSLSGPLTFMSSSKIDMIRNQLTDKDLNGGVIIDLSTVAEVDASGASQFCGLLTELLDRGVRIALRGASPKLRRMLLAQDSTRKLSNVIAQNEQDILRIFGKDSSDHSLSRLVFGVERFRKQLKPSYQALFDKLATGQQPHTLFVTCSDSRINPNLITATDPGELFIIRNVGNIIPYFGKDSLPAEGAAIEFSVGVLGVKDIIICGHSQCGAMKEIMTGDIFSPENSRKFPSIAGWLEDVRSVKDNLRPGATIDDCARQNVKHQVENLLSYPIIREKIERGELRIHSWFYDLGVADLEEWDQSRQAFVRVGGL